MSAATRRLFGPEHEDYRASVCRWLEREVVPHRTAWAAAGQPPGDAYAAAAALGFASAAVPEALGGAGVDDPLLHVIVAEESMRAGASGFGVPLALHDGVGVPALLAFGGSRGLPRGDDGALVVPTLHDELALVDGRVEGRTGPLAGAVHAATAVVVARDGDGEVVVLAVALDGPEVERCPVPDAIGLADGGIAELGFSGAEAHALGGGAELRGLQARERLVLAVLALSAARRALALTSAYVAERRAFGTPIAAFQNTRMMLADVVADIAVLQPFLDGCLEALGAGDLRSDRAALGLLRAGEAMRRAVDTGVQLHGGYGYMLEYPIARLYADAHRLRLAGGGPVALREEIARASAA